MPTMRYLLFTLLVGCAGVAGEGATYETREQVAARKTVASHAETWKRAEAAFTRRAYDAAEKDYRALAVADVALVEPRVRLAQIATRQHRHGEAERWLREAIALDPDNLDRRYSLVSCLLRQRRVDDARKELQAAGGDERPAVVRLKAAMALRAGRLEQAMTFYDGLLAADSRDASAHLGLGVVRALAGDYEGAIVSFDRAIALDADSALAWYDRALVRHRQGLREEAVSDARTAIALDPWYLPARNNLAAILIELDRHDEARTELEAALALRPSYAPAHGNLGVLLLASGDVKGAIASLGRAIHHSPHTAAFHFNLGVAHWKNGDLAAARKSFEQVRTLDPQNRSAINNLRFLDGLERGTLRGSLPHLAGHYAVEGFEG